MKINSIPMKPPTASSTTPLLNINSMKTPNASSTIPHLLDIDPSAPFEFHYPADEPWWDEFDFDNDTSDYFSCDSLSICSSESEFEPCEDPNLSFSSNFYHICDIAPAHQEAIPIEEVCRRSPREEDDVDKEEEDVKKEVDDEEVKSSLVSTLVSTISEIAPRGFYKRRKNSMKRKRNRKKRKRMFVSAVDPEFHSLYDNVGDLFVQSSAESKVPPSNLPTINLGNINRTMLRRLPEVVDVPIISVSEKPEFYTKIVGNAVTRTTSIPFTQFDRPGGCCHGKLPAILTDIGPIPPPTESQYGYVYVDGGWKVKAECPRIPDPGGRRGGGYDGGGRVGGAERRESGRRKLCER